MGEQMDKVRQPDFEIDTRPGMSASIEGRKQVLRQADSDGDDGVVIRESSIPRQESLSNLRRELESLASDVNAGLAAAKDETEGVKVGEGCNENEVVNEKNEHQEGQKDCNAEQFGQEDPGFGTTAHETLPNIEASETPEMRRNRARSFQSAPGAYALGIDFAINEDSLELWQAARRRHAPLWGTSHSDRTPVANPIVVETAAEATPIDPELSQNRESFSTARAKSNSLLLTYLVWGLAGIGVAIIAIVVLAVAFSSSATDSTTTEPIGAPTSVALADYLLPFLPNYTQIMVQNRHNSSQALAFDWLLEDPNLLMYSPDRLIQRFSMAVVYFSTGGPRWKHHGGGMIEVQLPAREDSALGIGSRPVGPGKGAIHYTNVTSELWLSYESHECDWLSMSLARGDVTCLDNETLTDLFLEENQLKGTLPEELGLLTSLTSLVLLRNELRGTIPARLGAIKDLQYLRLSANKFTGTVPSQLGLLSSLKEVSLRDNQLTGSLSSEIWHLSNLDSLRFGKNQITGTFPNNVCSSMPKLRLLRSDQNQLSGTIPSSLGQCSDLMFLDLSGMTAITGTIPSELGNLVEMIKVDLDKNSLFGSIPSELGLWEQVDKLDLNGNVGLSGPLPSNLQIASFLDITSTAISGTLPSHLCSIKTLKFDCEALKLCGCGCACATRNTTNNADKRQPSVGQN